MNYEEIESLLTEVEELNKKGNFEKAELTANELLEKLEKISDSTDTARQGDELRCGALIKLSISQWRRGDYATALTHALASLDLAEAKNLAGETKAKALGNIGIVYSLLSDYTQALSYFQKALAIHEEIGSKDGIAINLGNIGNVYSNLSDYAQALSYYQKALAINEEIGNKKGLADNLGNIGTVYKYLSDYAQALSYCQKSLDIFEEIGNKKGLADNLGNIGIVYSNLLDYAQALSYYQKALAIYEEIGSKNGIAIILSSIGQLHANKQFDGYDADKAEEYLQRAMALCEDMGEKRTLYEIHQALAELYETQERWKEHSIQFKKYHNLKEEVQSEEATKQSQIMENRRKVEESERDRQVKLARFQEQEKILLNILPAQIAERILEGEKRIADLHEHVSVFFSDIVGFTKLSQTVTPDELLSMLNEIFSEFDRIARKHGLEKIKTIGDAYMAVAGVPMAQEDHAERAAAFAIDVIEYMKEYRKTSKSELQIRVGLHCGRAIAGVIGENKFAYDLWGDSVNTASRMESHGEAGRVHVSEDFRNALKSSSLHFTERGKMEVKGKGMMKTYFIEKSN